MQYTRLGRLNEFWQTCRLDCKYCLDSGASGPTINWYAVRIMISAIGYLALVFVRNPEPTQGTATIKFSDAKEISRQGTTYFESNVTFGGTVFTNAMTSPYEHNGRGGGSFVYIIPKGMKSFSAEVGVEDKTAYNDNYQFTIPSSYAVSLDEKEIKKGDLEPRAKPFHLSIDVSGSKIIKVELYQGAGLGNPVFSKSPADLVSRSSLLSPENKADISGPTVELQWSKVPDAVSYSVEIVNTSWDDSDTTSPRIWSTTTKDTKYPFNLKGLPRGKYRWSVIAFGSKKVLGEWSTERSFTLTN